MDTSTPEPQAPAEAALRAAGVSFRVVRHRRASSLAEAAALRGVEPRDIIKTLVVRRASDDFVFVLVPGDREISWPKLRAALGVNRLSLPDAATAFGATGYERGTITPFGSSVACGGRGRVRGRQVDPLGAGEHGATVLLEADAALAALGAQVMDISGPLA